MKYKPLFVVSIFLLLVFGFFILKSVAPSIFPSYFWYYVLSTLVFIVFSLISFDILSIFYKHFYVFSIILLLATLLIGQVTRGTVRWIPIGSLTLQSAELVRPFLLIFFATYLTQKELDLKRLIKGFLLLALPTILILAQPSLGVALLGLISFIGVFLACDFKKKYLLYAGLSIFLLLPLLWFIMAPYQKQRIFTFLDPSKDPLGAGYNSIQSMISVGSGMFSGRGFGKGIGTQLLFLPERHTDFIFASTVEEMGFMGGAVILSLTLLFFINLVSYTENATTPGARAFVSGLFLTLFAQVFIHVGMNMGLLPITGVPYPLVSAGGSSLLATMISLGIIIGTKRH